MYLIIPKAKATTIQCTIRNVEQLKYAHKEHLSIPTFICIYIYTKKNTKTVGSAVVL